MMSLNFKWSVATVAMFNPIRPGPFLGNTDPGGEYIAPPPIEKTPSGYFWHIF